MKGAAYHRLAVQLRKTVDKIAFIAARCAEIARQIDETQFFRESDVREQFGRFAFRQAAERNVYRVEINVTREAQRCLACQSVMDFAHIAAGGRRIVDPYYFNIGMIDEKAEKFAGSVA